jgi:hypothetical protein
MSLWVVELHKRQFSSCRTKKSSTLALAATAALTIITATTPPASALVRDDGDEPGQGLLATETLLLFIGVPVAMTALIVAAVVIPTWFRQVRLGNRGNWSEQPIWVNGPDQSADTDDVIMRAIRGAQDESGFIFSGFIGALPEGDTTVAQLKNQLAHPDRTILVATDPDRRFARVVVGEDAAIWCNQRAREMALLAVMSAVSVGDPIGGVRDAIALLGDQSQRPAIANEAAD